MENSVGSILCLLGSVELPKVFPQFLVLIAMVDPFEPAVSRRGSLQFFKQLYIVFFQSLELL